MNFVRMSVAIFVCLSQFAIAEITLPNFPQTKPFLMAQTKPFVLTNVTGRTTTPIYIEVPLNLTSTTTSSPVLTNCSTPLTTSSIPALNETMTSMNNSTVTTSEAAAAFNYHLDRESGSNCSKENDCGVSSQDKIVGGTLASPNEFPWLAHLIIEKGSLSALCTGFLVTNRHVITAAHCTKGSSDDSVSLTLGTNNPGGGSSSLRLKSIKIVVHPDYEERGNLNDVSVITVDKSVSFTDTVRPICLPVGTDDYVGKISMIAGWGTLSEGGDTSDRLRKATVPVLNNEDSKCVEAYGNTLMPQMICAGGGSMDTCQGDSGGPLMISDNGIFTAIGIVSFGIGCARPSTPGVYARITALRAFIDPQITNGKTCDQH